MCRETSIVETNYLKGYLFMKNSEVLTVPFMVICNSDKREVAGEAYTSNYLGRLGWYYIGKGRHAL